jgi:hypothetical protein
MGNDDIGNALMKQWAVRGNGANWGARSHTFDLVQAEFS